MHFYVQLHLYLHFGDHPSPGTASAATLYSLASSLSTNGSTTVVALELFCHLWVKLTVDRTNFKRECWRHTVQSLYCFSFRWLLGLPQHLHSVSTSTWRFWRSSYTIMLFYYCTIVPYVSFFYQRPVFFPSTGLLLFLLGSWIAVLIANSWFTHLMFEKGC